MTMTMTMPDRSSRWLLIGSLALNLFFIGTLASLAARAYMMPGQPAATERPRTAAARIERLAADLNLVRVANADDASTNAFDSDTGLRP